MIPEELDSMDKTLECALTKVHQFAYKQHNQVERIASAESTRQQRQPAARHSFEQESDLTMNASLASFEHHEISQCTPVRPAEETLDKAKESSTSLSFHHSSHKRFGHFLENLNSTESVNQLTENLDDLVSGSLNLSETEELIFLEGLFDYRQGGSYPLPMDDFELTQYREIRNRFDSKRFLIYNKL